MALWGTFDPRVLFIFVVCLSVAEVFVQVRWRMGLRCQHCGFDPVVYMRDPKRAARLVRAQFEQRSENVEFLFTESPVLREAARAQFKAKWAASDSFGSDGIGSDSLLQPAEEQTEPSVLDSASQGSHFELAPRDEFVDGGLTRT